MRRLAGLEESRELPLAAAEDALRSRAADLKTLSRNSLISRFVKTPSGDGLAHIEALTNDLGVERERFSMFVKAARRVMLIDAAREKRLAGLSSIDAARQRRGVRARMAENESIIRGGVRLMRRRVGLYRRHLAELPLAWPDAPLGELEKAFDELNNEVIGFHAEIDLNAYERLAGGEVSYK
jgi:hypothetical protein